MAGARSPSPTEPARACGRGRCSCSVPTPSEYQIEILLAGSLRTPAGGDNCALDDQVTPATWRLTGLITATISNTDPAIAPRQQGQARHLYACPAPTGIELVVGILMNPAR
jgi:hypothetical protein